MAKSKKKATGVRGATGIVAKLDALREQDDFKAIVRLACESIERAKSAKDVEALLDAEAIEDMFLGEDDAGPEIACALVDAAFRVGGKEGARILAIASGAAFFDATEPFFHAQGDASTIKPDFVAGLGGAADRLTRAVDDATPTMRAASMYALAVCPTSGASALEHLLDRWQAEKVLEVRATATLAAAVLSRRLGTKTPLAARATEAVRAEEKPALADKAGQLRVVAVGLAEAILGLGWSPALMKALTAALKKPVTLPSTWGFPEGSTTVALISPAIRSPA